MKLVVMIPALNEGESIRKVLNRIPTKIKGVDSVVKLVVDDGSTDDTVKEAESAGAEVVSHQQNMGVGAAFQTGLQYTLDAKADVMVNIDADGQFNPEDIPNLVRPVIGGEADLAASDRFTNSDSKLRKPENMSGVKYWGNMQMARLISLLSGQKFPDVSSGFRAYSKKALLMMNLTGRFT